MLHAGACDFCSKQGWLGFYLCDDHETIVLLCVECETVYLSPEDRDRGSRARVSDTLPYIVEPINVPIVGGRDATSIEVTARGWGARIEGDTGST